MNSGDFRASITEEQWSMLRQLYGTPDWLREADVLSLLEYQPAMHRDALYRTAGFLGFLVGQSVITQSIEHVIEFGSGTGEGIVALGALRAAMSPKLRLSAAELDPHDIGEYRASELMCRKFFGSDGEVAHDGLELLERNTAGTDLVVAHMLGPVRLPRDVRFIDRFVVAASAALKPNGTVALYSDDETIRHLADAVHAGAPEIHSWIVNPDELPILFRQLPVMLWNHK